MEVSVDGGSTDAELRADLGDSPPTLAVGVDLVVHGPGQLRRRFVLLVKVGLPPRGGGLRCRRLEPPPRARRRHRAGNAVGYRNDPVSASAGRTSALHTAVR